MNPINAPGSTGKDGRTKLLSISGMTCDGCVNTVTRILSRVPGVRSADVNLATGRAVVTGEARPDELLAAVRGAGYGAEFGASDATEGKQDEHGRSGCC